MYKRQLLYDVINEVLDYQVTLIDPGREAAKSVQSFLTVNGLLSERQQEMCIRDSLWTIPVI